MQKCNEDTAKRIDDVKSMRNNDLLNTCFSINEGIPSAFRKLKLVSL